MKIRIQLACVVIVLLLTLGASHCSDTPPTPDGARGAAIGTATASSAATIPTSTATSEPRASSTKLPVQLATIPPETLGTAATGVTRIKFLNVPNAVAGQDADVLIAFLPNVGCRFTFTSPPSNTSGSAATGVATTSASGLVSWTWSLAADTPPGIGTIDVQCNDAEAHTTIVIEAPGVASPTPSDQPDVTAFPGYNERLATALPTLNDLPAGWIRGQFADISDMLGPNGTCDNETPDANVSVTPFALVLYSSKAAAHSSLISAHVNVLGVQGAAAYMDAVRVTLACDSFVDADTDPPVTWSVHTVTTPPIGDDVYVVVVNSADSTSSVAVVLVRQGEFLVGVTESSESAPDTHLLIEPAQLIGQRLQEQFPNGFQQQ